MTAVAAPPALPDDGHIAMRVRIGVIGHRRLDDEAAVRREVRARLRVVADAFASTETTEVRFTLLSSLAEGADRLVVSEATSTLAPRVVELTAVLPLAADDYAADFTSDASRAEFRAYLDSATTVVATPAVPGGGREAAYLRAGRDVVDRSDLLIALWDGRPAHGVGGTADIVAYARDTGVAVLTVPTANASRPLPAADGGRLPRHGPRRLERARDGLERLRVYNSRDSALPRLERRLRAQRPWRPEIADPPARELFVSVSDWVLPRFARAELWARRAQRRYHFVVDSLFALAAIAVAAVAWQISFQPERPRLALFETVSLVLLVFAFGIGRRLRLHEAWIGYRSLAEAFRSALFIATIAAEPKSGGPTAAFRDEPWFQRAFSEAWAARPAVSPEHCDVAALRGLLVDAWLGDQIAYHHAKAEYAERRHRAVTLVVEVLLAVAIVLSICHAFELFESYAHAADVLEFMAIALPGVSAGLTGHREHRQYRLDAERSRRTADRLRRAKAELEAASDLAAVRRLAGEAQAIMVEENRDWFGVAELQELEVSL